MTLESIMSFALIVAMLVIVPGPNGVLILKTVSFHGKRNGLANVFGFFTAFYLHGILSTFGLSALIVGSTRAFFVVKALGSFYLAYLGLKTLWSALKYKNFYKESLMTTVSLRRGLLSSYSEGILTNLLNPKVSMFYLAAFPQFIDFSSGLTVARVGNSLGLVTIHAAINFVWYTGIIFVIYRAVSRAKRSMIGRIIEGISGIVFIWFSYKLIMESRGS